MIRIEAFLDEILLHIISFLSPESSIWDWHGQTAISTLWGKRCLIICVDSKDRQVELSSDEFDLGE
jgi:hypothetical protein